jgi:hypothetical protein
MLHDAGDAARDTMTQIADPTVSVADRASHRLRDTIPDRDDRDTYLLGVAALAVASAVGIACHRRAPRGYATTRALRLPPSVKPNPGKAPPCALALYWVERGESGTVRDGRSWLLRDPPFKDTFHGQATEAP